MKLTRLQRHTAYILMLAESDRRYLLTGFCWLIWCELGIGNGCSDYYIQYYFPELYSKRPIPKSVFWFTKDESGWEQRKQILQQCIIETY